MSPKRRLICAPHLSVPHQQLAHSITPLSVGETPRPSVSIEAGGTRLEYPQDRLAGKVARHQPRSSRANRAPVRVDRHQRAKPTVGQQLEEAGKPLARSLNLDVARETEPLGAAVARQHEVADREGCAWPGPAALEIGTSVLVRGGQIPPRSG